MIDISSKPVLIDKEEVVNLKFPKEEILKTKEDSAARKINLERATTLGNLEQIKFKIVFADDKKVKMIDTTIWALTSERVILKKGVVIPINRIIDVKYA
ncbi:MAG: hypothetical protein IT239_02035 [Bacteroidia bacterium]|nr:hypothetical protein [Bacteroidia bacterium]